MWQDLGVVGVAPRQARPKHHGWGPWNIIPDPRKFGNFDAHMEYTEILRVEDYSEVPLEEVEPVA